MTKKFSYRQKAQATEQACDAERNALLQRAVVILQGHKMPASFSIAEEFDRIDGRSSCSTFPSVRALFRRTSMEMCE